MQHVHEAFQQRLCHWQEHKCLANMPPDNSMEKPLLADFNLRLTYVENERKSTESTAKPKKTKDVVKAAEFIKKTLALGDHWTGHCIVSVEMQKTLCRLCRRWRCLRSGGLGT